MGRKKKLEISEKITEDIVKDARGALHIKAPRRPFPWWGPSNPTDAIGRVLLFLGLWFLSWLFFGLTQLSPARLRTDSVEVFIFFIVMIVKKEWGFIDVCIRTTRNHIRGLPQLRTN